MKACIKQIPINSIEVELSKNVGFQQNDKRFLTLVKSINEETTRKLLYLHPIVVVKVIKRSRRKSKGQSGEQYRLIGGLHSYLLAKSMIDGRRVPVLHIEESDEDGILHLIDQLFTIPLVDLSPTSLIERWDYWTDNSPTLLEGCSRLLSENVRSLLLKEYQYSLIGITPAQVSKLKNNRKLKEIPEGGEQGGFGLEDSDRKIKKLLRKTDQAIKAAAFEAVMKEVLEQRQKKRKYIAEKVRRKASKEDQIWEEFYQLLDKHIGLVKNQVDEGSE